MAWYSGLFVAAEKRVWAGQGDEIPIDSSRIKRRKLSGVGDIKGLTVHFEHRK